MALIGSNGAGKSTCLKAITGILRPVEGSIRFDGEELATAPAHRIVARGMSWCPRDGGFSGTRPSWTTCCSAPTDAGAAPADQAPARARARSTSSVSDPARAADLPAGGLSGGQQQMLAISRGLMASPRLILLDEPSLGLAPLLVRQIFGIIRDLKRAGRTILLVEQMANLALRVADRAYILEQGRVVLEGTSEALLANPEVARGYLGRLAGSMPSGRGPAGTGMI